MFESDRCSVALTSTPTTIPHVTSIVSIFKIADSDAEGSRWSRFLYTVNYCMLAVAVLFILIHWQPLNQYIITDVIQDKLQWM